MLTAASNHRNRQRAVITAGRKNRNGLILNITNGEMGSPKSMLHINQSLIDQIELSPKVNVLPKDEPIIQPKWTQSHAEMLQSKNDHVSRQNQ